MRGFVRTSKQERKVKKGPKTAYGLHSDTVFIIGWGAVIKKPYVLVHTMYTVTGKMNELLVFFSLLQVLLPLKRAFRSE